MLLFLKTFSFYNSYLASDSEKFRCLGRTTLSRKQMASFHSFGEIWNLRLICVCISYIFLLNSTISVQLDPLFFITVHNTSFGRGTQKGFCTWSKKWCSYVPTYHMLLSVRSLLMPIGVLQNKLSWSFPSPSLCFGRARNVYLWAVNS